MGTCNWEISYAECNERKALESLDPEIKSQVEAMAVEFLWNWTGRAFGACPVTVRPCRAGCLRSSTFWTSPLSESPSSGRGGVPSGARMFASENGTTIETTDQAGEVYTATWIDTECGCESKCSCDSTDDLRTLRLLGPVAAITRVRLDGVELLPTSYRVDNGALLVRTDGGTWPTCQEMPLAPTEPGTFEVSYLRGVPVPAGGQIAAGLLAAEMAKAVCNRSDCQLPQRIQTITRQGVSMTLLDEFTDLEKGRTGIWLVDSWIASTRQNTRLPAVLSPDYRSSGRNRVTTWQR